MFNRKSWEDYQRQLAANGQNGAVPTVEVLLAIYAELVQLNTTLSKQSPP
jgi:hypothetical protein